MKGQKALQKSEVKLRKEKFRKYAYISLGNIEKLVGGKQAISYALSITNCALVTWHIEKTEI